MFLSTVTSDTLALTGLEGVVNKRRDNEDEAANDDRGTCARGKARTIGRMGFMIVVAFSVQPCGMFVSYR